MADFSGLEGFGPHTAQELENAGYDSFEDIAAEMPEELAQSLDINESTAAEIVDSAREQTTDFLGFETGSEFEPEADLTDIDVREDIYGWSLFIHDHRRIGWESPAGYRLLIQGPRNRIYGSLPHEEQEEPDKITAETVLQNKMASPEEAVSWAEEWMTKRAIDPDTALSEYTGVGEKLSEHLQIVYGVTRGGGLYRFLCEDEEKLRSVIGTQYFDQLKEELEAEFYDY